MTPPIVVAAFGTTTKARETYSFMDKIIREQLPEREILWAYTSRQVKTKVKSKENLELKHPHEVLSELKKQGHDRVVVQSLHMICGHEYHRLREDIRQCEMDCIIGLPLLCSSTDYNDVVRALDFQESIRAGQAVVLVGHGTNHPCWSTYLAMENMLREIYGPSIHVGVISGFPSRERVIGRIIESGIKQVRLIPFLLVAGVHFNEDLAGDEDSWKKELEKNGLSVLVEEEGLGFNQNIIEIYIRHLKEALASIPQ